MRLLHTFEDQKKALEFSNFLARKGIENQCEVLPNTDWGSSDYGTVKCVLWIYEEDDFQSGERWLEEYLKNPSNPIFQEEEKWKQALPEAFKEMPQKFKEAGRNAIPIDQKGLGFVTLYLLIGCIVLFIYANFTSPTVEEYYPGLATVPLEFAPIYKILMYDYPHAYEILDKLAHAYGLEKYQNLAELPLEGRLLLEQYFQTPYWKGFYEKIVNYAKNPARPWSFKAPLFEKIREGEVWRIFTPILLHANAIHLFFNIVWLVVLGKLIEDKLGSLRYLFLILITAAVSNTAQYLMSGPDFLGISGVICGMLGFIWARQHRAAWEGYNLVPGVISFMLFFILAIMGIQMISFFLQIYKNINFMPGIANTAHITGGLVGYLLGCLNIFGLKKYS
jgi:GlpG protein